jgi:cell division protease FtsH
VTRVTRPTRFALVAYLLFAAAVFVALNAIGRLATPVTDVAYSDFKAAVAAGRVKEVTVSPTRIDGTMTAAGGGGVQRFRTVRVDDPSLLHDLEAAHVQVSGEVERGLLRDLFGAFLAFLPLVVLWLIFVRREGARRGGLLAIGRSTARVYVEHEVDVTFDDVAGVDEAKEELQEVIEFLKTPEKFRRLGGKIPKGILLVGPPGTGKTLLARAVAGEAGVPFFSISGSEFVEMFVGVGAARVRDLFLQAKEHAPCIVFIDELDALGKARGVGPMAHEEREQTLNQLLVEMDGFDPRAGVILMAATNRPEILDPALLRAGRFDRHVVVDRPDKAGRLAILRVHARGVTMGPDADLGVVAAMTPGFAGADLANVVNEAALLAARRGRDAVGGAELQEAVERVVAGLQKKNRLLNPMERERVAHHEVGHALVALAMPGADPVQKISIIPRGIAALGYTIQVPTEDRFLMTQAELETKIAVLLGGRVAEQLVYGDASTGAQDDLQKATDVARRMVRAYGMSRTLGAVSFEREPPPLFVPLAPGAQRGDYGDETAQTIDAEVRRILDEQEARVATLLAARREVLREAAALLLAKETISGDELRAIAAPPAARPAGAA